MLTQVRTPQEIFFMPQRLTVPLFQRPYVWSEEAQWRPLWDDIERLTKRRMGGEPSATHFLGAAVLQQQAHVVGALAVRSVIDGQQRLTTLQVLLDAMHAVMVARGHEMEALQLANLISNGPQYRLDDDDEFKVWPTNRDRAAFREVMSASGPVDYTTLTHSTSRLTRAHAFFASSVDTWLGLDDSPARAANLVSAVTTQLQLVVIELQYDEDAQEIFETLNARGTPLTPADLIKNFVFQRLDLPPERTEAAYFSYWAEFETPFWETEVTSGRVTYSRSSLFLNHWLVANTMSDVPAREVFTQFKRYSSSIEHMGDLLPQIKTSSDAYRDGIVRAADRTAILDREAMFIYRTGTLDSEIVKPLLIWLKLPNQGEIPLEQAVKTLSVVESWLVRRALVRANSQGANRFMVDFLAHLGRQAPTEVGDAAEAFLQKQTASTSYWPDDAEVRRELRSQPVYRKLRRGRLRMVLEAIEDHYRGFTSSRPKHEQPVIRETCTIEHVMPQGWQRHWPLDGADQDERDRRVQSLGNLTLVTQSLNSRVSNAPWTSIGGKREALNEHTSLLMTRTIVENSPAVWDDDDIDARTRRLTDAILEIWPVPEGHHRSSPDSPERARRQNRVEVADLVRAGILQPGARLWARPKSVAERIAEVSEDGQLWVDGRAFATPSAAAKSVTGSQSEAGWWFWLVDPREKRSLDTLRSEYLEATDGEDPEMELDDDVE